LDTVAAWLIAPAAVSASARTPNDHSASSGTALADPVPTTVIPAPEKLAEAGAD
jgi:hypothetical protein